MAEESASELTDAGVEGINGRLEFGAEYIEGITDPVSIPSD